jgi:hypothetical protein
MHPSFSEILNEPSNLHHNPPDRVRVNATVRDFESALPNPHALGGLTHLGMRLRVNRALDPPLLQYSIALGGLESGLNSPRNETVCEQGL